MVLPSWIEHYETTAELVRQAALDMCRRQVWHFDDQYTRDDRVLDHNTDNHLIVDQNRKCFSLIASGPECDLLRFDVSFKEFDQWDRSQNSEYGRL